MPQKVVARGGRDTDVLGVARHARRAAVAALILRGGSVVGKETRLIERAGELDDAAVLHVFLSQHYLAPRMRRVAW